MRLKKLLPLIAIIVAVCAAYAPVVRDGFVWDDTALILRDPLIRSWRLIPEGFQHFLFTDATPSDFYRPIQRLTYTFEYWAFAARPAAYHVTSVLCHVAAALAFLLFANEFLGRFAIEERHRRVAVFFATLAWAVHPLHHGAVAYVSGRADPLSAAFGFADKIGQILIPTEEVVELRNGKKVTSKRLVYPGYVLVEMEMSDALWHEVKNTPRVTGFVGGGNSPVPLSADEVNQILYRQQTAAERPRPKMTFEKNDSVRIVDGPFANFSGKVDEVNMERGTLRVMVTIFGRATPVELEFLQVEKS